jgi:hypothetical protein
VAVGFWGASSGHALKLPGCLCGQGGAGIPPKIVKPALDVVHSPVDLTLLLTIHVLTLSLTTSIQRFNLRRWPASIIKEIVLNISVIDLSEVKHRTF